MVKTYADNAQNRKLGRVGMPVGSYVVSRDGEHLGSKTYTDNAQNRSLGRVGLLQGSVPESSLKTYADNAQNKRLGRVGMPIGSCVVSRDGEHMGSRTYVDNYQNRSLGRVGMFRGSMPESSVTSNASTPPTTSSRYVSPSAYRRMSSYSRDEQYTQPQQYISFTDWQDVLRFRYIPATSITRPIPDDTMSWASYASRYRSNVLLNPQVSDAQNKSSGSVGMRCRSVPIPNVIQDDDTMSCASYSSGYPPTLPINPPIDSARGRAQGPTGINPIQKIPASNSHRSTPDSGYSGNPTSINEGSLSLHNTSAPVISRDTNRHEQTSDHVDVPTHDSIKLRSGGSACGKKYFLWRGVIIKCNASEGDLDNNNYDSPSQSSQFKARTYVDNTQALIEE